MISKTRTIFESSASPPAAGGLRWSVEQRLAFIDDRLFWLGQVNRTDLVRRFGVSMSQASADIARYLALAPTGVAYDKSAKCYIAGKDFRPVTGAPDARRLLGELRLADLGVLTPEDTMLGVLPPFAAAPLPERTADPLVLRSVLHAIRERRALDVQYQSLSRPEPMRRTIEPHAFAHDGFRWHARAFDQDSGEFRDFVLGRMSRPKDAGPAASTANADESWRTFIALVIGPHPELTPAQSRAIAMDYGIRGGSTSLRVRRALVFYALRRLGLDLAPGARPPTEQHIVLLNRPEVEAALGRRSET